jgi:hypothetical protein
MWEVVVIASRSHAVLIVIAFICLIAFMLAGCGGTTAPNDVACFAGSMEHTFAFESAGAQVVDVPELVRTSGAGRWSTMLSPAEMPAGDNVASFFTLTSGQILSREFLDNARFEPVPLSDGALQDVAELVTEIPTADEVLVGARVQYNSHDAARVVVHVAAEACAKR